MLKPAELRTNPPSWPPQREMIRHVELRLVSLHQLPTRKEQRPDVHDSPHHKWVPKLSGLPEPPQASGGVISPSLVVSLHAIGGYCSVSTKKKASRKKSSTSFYTDAVDSNGLNAFFGHTIHLFAAEPEHTILHISVQDSNNSAAATSTAGMGHVAYEAVVLGTLRQGYRCIPLRSRLGTRIEMCSLLVHISMTRVANPIGMPDSERVKQHTAFVAEQAETIQGLHTKIDALESALRRSQQTMDSLITSKSSGSIPSQPSTSPSRRVST